MATEEHNYSHEISNWRQRLVKETKAAQDFDQLYDYLKGTPTEQRRGRGAVKVKYYKASGGDWTVKDKSVPLRATEHERIPIEEEAIEMRVDPATRRDAMRTCSMTHALVTAADGRRSALHRPMSEAVGRRNTLEMFGVTGHGRLATRTKQPVGNGTKIYYT